MKGIYTSKDRWAEGNGPSLKMAKDSFTGTIDAISYEYLNVPLICRIATLVKEAGIRFLEVFYSRYVYGDLVYTEESDNAFKKRQKDLLYFVESLSRSIEGYVVIDGIQDEPLELQYLKYYPNSKGGSLIYFKDSEDSEDGLEVTDVYRLVNKPKIFACLMRCVLKIYKILNEEVTTKQISLICYQIALQLVSVSGISGFFNTTKAEKVAYLDATYQRLTVDRTEELKYYRDRDLYELLRDPVLIERDVLIENFDAPEFQGVYIKDVFDRFLKAIRLRRDLKSGLLAPILRTLKRVDALPKEYSEKDLYVSVRSNPGEVPEGFVYMEKVNGKWKKKTPSEAIIKSAFEDDIVNCPEFDKAVKFCYEYNARGDRSYNGWVHTIICIDNPNKYKPRIIHLFVNCVNDRLMYFNNRAQKRHRWDPILCTDDHKVGRDFVRDCTSKSFRLQDENKDASLILADWSDATDNIEQQFFLDCVEAFDCRERRLLWEEILKIPFVMKYPDGSIREGKQINGQPQGGPDSFTSFCDEGELIHAVAHYLQGCTGTLTDTLRAVGDDSCKVSRGDPQGRYFAIYSLLCSWAGLKINASKSLVLKPSDEDWSAEFCKVSSLNGQYFSKIPHKLMFNFSKSDADWLGMLVWCQNYGYNVSQYVKDNLEIKFPNEAKLIISSLTEGWSKGLLCFKETDIPEGYHWDIDNLKFLLSFVVAHIRCCIVDAFMADHKQDELEAKNIDPWENCYKYFHNQKIHDDIMLYVNSKHKLITLMEDNYKVNSLLRDIMTDKIILSECNNLPSLTILRQSEEGFQQIEFVVNIWRVLKAKDFTNWEELYYTQYTQILYNCMSLLKDTKIHQFSSRTLGKKASNSGKIFQKTVEIFRMFKDEII